MNFKEVQYFRQWWVWVIMIGINIAYLWGVYQQLIGNSSFGGDEPLKVKELVFSLVILESVTVLFYFLHLRTTITNEGVYIRFFPFHFREKFYPWETIKSAQVRNYSPISEYGGWGIRGFGKNRAYNITGKVGLQLELTSGKRILIGTQLGNEINECLKSFKRNS